MKFNVLNTESTYRRLLAAPDAAAREAIFCDELIAPFQGLVNIMGGGDGLAAFKQWRMWPEQFAGEQGAQMAQNLAGLSEANAFARAAQSLEYGAAAFADYEDQIPPVDVTFGLMLADLSGGPVKGHDYTGFGAIPGWVMTVYGTPNDYNLPRVEACTVHELHHNILARVFPVNMMTWTVGEYMVMEGLAESFAAELYGEDTIGFWVSDFDYTRLAATKTIIRDGLEVTGFNAIRGYIFGEVMAGMYGGIEKVDVPAYAGYAIGYHLVQTYLEKTGKSVAEATFVPAREIIEESGYLG